jgi:hypothetical protein
MKTTATQQKVLTDYPTKPSYCGTTLYPLFGAGDHRAMRSLEKKGIGKLVTSSMYPYAANDYWFEFNDGYGYNYKYKCITHQV